MSGTVIGMGQSTYKSETVMAQARWPVHAVALAVVAFIATLSACGSDEGPEGTTVSLQFCDGVDWVAFQDGTGPWQHIVPVAGRYEATFNSARGGIASVDDQEGGSDIVSVRFGEPEELTMRCSQGAAQVSGTVTAIAEAERVEVYLAGSNAFMDGIRGITSFDLRRLPEGTLDLFGVRYEDLVTDPAPTKFIIRRGIDVPHAGNLAPLDFESAEAFTSTDVEIAVTGLDAAANSFVATHLYDRNGWMRDVGGAFMSSPLGTTCPAVPIDRLVPGELLVISAFGQDPLGLRLAYTFYRAAEAPSVAMGRELNRPDLTFPNSTPYLRPLARLASQSEYDNVVRIAYDQDHHYASVEVSSAYLGGMPATWELELPDFSGVEGWDNSWGLDPAEALQWRLEAEGGDSPWELATRRDGDRFVWAAQGSDDGAAETARNALASKVRPKTR